MMLAGVLLTACGLVLAATDPRDPFAPPPPPAEQRAAMTGLQRLDISQLRLVALVHGDRSRALLEDQTGLGYVASLGTPIGPRGGTVVSIDRRALRIQEPGSSDAIVLELAAGERDTR